MTWYPESYVQKVPMTNMEMRAAGGYPGRTYRFYKGPVVFPFGAGMSYTNFKQSLAHAPTTLSVPLLAASLKESTNMTELSDEVKVAHTSCDSLNLELHVDVKNTGDMDGTHTVMVFSTPPRSKNTAHPEKQLVAFEKVHVMARAQTRVRLNVNACKHLSVVDQSGIRRIPTGEHNLHIGDDLKHSVSLQTSLEQIKV